MIDINVILAKLDSELTYSVELAQAIQPILTEITTLPKIYINYSNITSKNPNEPIEFSLFNTHGEDLVQSFDIQIVCETSNFSIIWKNIYQKLIGWNPVGEELYHSGFTYAEGGIIGIDNTRLIWVDRWRIGFPTFIPTV